MKYDLHVKLGCWGLQQDNFVLCNGIENVILSIGPATPNYTELMDYFDQMRLFDRPMFEWNAILHVIHNLQEKFSLITKPTWLPKQHERIQKYLQHHKGCGVYIKLVLADEAEVDVSIAQPVAMNVSEKPAEEIFIPSRRTLRLIKK